MFTLAQLREMGFEVIDGHAVRITPARADASPVVSPAMPSSAPAKRWHPPRAPHVVPVDEFARSLEVDGWRSGDVLYLCLAIPPRTKKNSKEWLGRESAAYRTFRKRVINAIQLVKQRLRLQLPERTYNACVLFVADNPLTDCHGLYQERAVS